MHVQTVIAVRLAHVLQRWWWCVYLEEGMQVCHVHQATNWWPCRPVLLGACEELRGGGRGVLIWACELKTEELLVSGRRGS